MRRTLWAILALAFAADVAVAVYVADLMRFESASTHRLERKRELVEIRKMFFTRYVDDRSIATASPERLRELGYRTDSPEAIAAWREEIVAKLPYLQAIDADALPKDPIERAKAVVLLFSKNGGMGRCGLGDLATTLGLIAQGGGYGCCSDHSDAFVALGQAFGLVVRPVATEHHAVDEVFLPDAQRWVFVDPQYALMAHDEGGRSLGVFEIRERLRDGEPVRYEFFGTAEHDFWPARDGEPSWDRNRVASAYYLDFDGFRDLRLSWGSNLVEQDRFDVRWHRWPLALRSFAAHVLRIAPVRVHYLDADSRYAGELQAGRTRLLAGLTGLALATGLPALLLRLTRR